jgi:hypothetical protein
MAVMSRPSNDTVPARTGTTPIRHLSSVVLPTPLRPSKAVTLPAGTSKLTSRSVWLLP